VVRLLGKAPRKNGRWILDHLGFSAACPKQSKASITSREAFEKEMSLLAKPVWKLKIPKLNEKDLLVFDLEIEWACNASTSNGLE
jgi:hypothetical protein